MNNNVSASVTSNVLYKRIVRMIWDSPSLFKNRSDALHHLFCVNGIGYTWEKGILRRDDEDEQGNRLPLRNPQGEILPPRNLDDVFRSEQEEIEEWQKTYQDCLDDEFAQVIRANRLIWVREHNIKMRFRRDNADLLALVTGDRTKIYSLCQYARMATVPDDVHPDYLEGVREMIFLVFQTPANNFASGYSEKEREKNIQFASNVLTQLSQRFPKGHEHEPTSYEGWLQHREEITKISIQITEECIAELKKEEEQRQIFLQQYKHHQLTHTIYSSGVPKVLGHIGYLSGDYEVISQDESLSEYWDWISQASGESQLVEELEALISELESKGFTVEPE